ncbi:Uncharacterized protein Rs2_07070 [Raphanus sativus]|nr:Uncharacterized protein Rs2_07070 [Raphanus sativus]
MLGLRRRSSVRLGTNISIFLFSNSSSHHLSSHISLGREVFINCGGTAASFLGSEECEARWGAQVVGFVPGRCKRKLFSRFMLMKIRLNDFSGATLSLSSTVTDPVQDNNHVMATIKMDNDMSVTMSLFDSQVVKRHNQLEMKRGDPRVVVATSVNPKIVGGWSRKTGLAPAAPLLRGNAKVESLSIAVLNDFVIAAPSQAC